MLDEMEGKIKIGVIGAGTMGVGIAQVAATAGHQVYLYDANEEAVNKGLNGLKKVFDRLVEKGKFTSDQAQQVIGRIEPVDSLLACKDTGLVIEAIVEDLGIKQNIFAELESIVDTGAILATNTSSLSVTAIAGACKRPGRVVGLHFFNPAPLLPLVEVVPGLASDPARTQEALDLMRSWGKVPVQTKDTPGFIVNRVARPFYGEAIRIYEEGLADIPTIDRAMKEVGGFRMGPFELMDLIGNDINYTVTETVFREFFYDPRYKPSFTQKRMVEAGWLGRKSGKGYYAYDEENDPSTHELNKRLAEDIVWRILVMLINEAADALYLKIASREDIELAMTKGVNYPKGLLAWADEKRIDHCLATMERLHEEYGEDRYRPSPLLRRMAREGTTFFELETTNN